VTVSYSRLRNFRREVTSKLYLFFINVVLIHPHYRGPMAPQLRLSPQSPALTQDSCACDSQIPLPSFAVALFERRLRASVRAPADAVYLAHQVHKHPCLIKICEDNTLCSHRCHRRCKGRYYFALKAESHRPISFRNTQLWKAV
jgi:hypothetical protein